MTLPIWILVTIAIVGATLCGWAMFQAGKAQHAKSPIQTNTRTQGHATETNEENSGNRSQIDEGAEADRFEPAESHSDVFSIIGTFLLVLMTGLLWVATRDLVKSSERVGNRQVAELKKSNAASAKAAKAADDGVQFARENANIERRAWVLAAGVTIKNRPKAGDPMTATLEMTNSGRTPANNLKMHPQIILTRESRIKNFLTPPKLESIPQGAVMVPNKSIFLDRTIPAEVMTDAELTAINTGKKWVFIAGIASYDLVGGGQGESGFCYIYDPSIGGFSPYAEGNYAR